MTWVVAEHTAGGAGEVSVSKGQQVEVLEAWAARPDWWLVRVPGEPPQEGAVPATVLKPQPHQKTSPSRRPLSQPSDEAIEASSSEPGVSASAASPGKHRKGIIPRWIPRPSKSQGKGEKTPGGAKSPASADKPSLKKVPSEKKLKLPNVESARIEDGETSVTAIDDAEDDAPDVELPPPMKPIQDPQAVLQQAPIPATTAAAPVAREQHGGCGVGAPRADDDDEAASADCVEATLKKREYVLRELYDTEEIYVADLRLVCEGYMKHMMEPNSDPPIPDGLRDRRLRMIFGNIQAIYEWHRDKFVRELESCIESPELLGPLFRRFLEKKMFLYEVYCRNKPVSEYIVSEHDHYFQELRHKLGQKLQLGDLLIKPIQRIQKYHLLVKKVLTYSEAANAPPDVLAALGVAVHCTSIIPKNANDMMDVGRLQGFMGNIAAQGKLLFQEPLVVSDATSTSDKGKELHVFLFEQCVIFTEAVGKKSQFTSPTYNYKHHVQVNKMSLEEVEGSNSSFIIHAVGSMKPKQSFLCRAPEPRCRHWISELSTILQSQVIFGERLENPSAFLNRDAANSGEGWGGVRKTESVPPSEGARLAPELRGRMQRAHCKANTINLPPTATTPTSPHHHNV